MFEEKFDPRLRFHVIVNLNPIKAAVAERITSSLQGGD